MPEEQKSEEPWDDQDSVLEYDAKNNAMVALDYGQHHENADKVKAVVLEIVRPIWKRYKAQIDPSLTGDAEMWALIWARRRAQYEAFKQIPWEEYTTPEKAAAFRKHILRFLPYSERQALEEAKG